MCRCRWAELRSSHRLSSHHCLDLSPVTGPDSPLLCTHTSSLHTHTPLLCTHLHPQNKALRERLHAVQGAAEENSRLKADIQQLCQQMVCSGWLLGHCEFID